MPLREDPLMFETPEEFVANFFDNNGIVAELEAGNVISRGIRSALSKILPVKPPALDQPLGGREERSFKDILYLKLSIFFRMNPELPQEFFDQINTILGQKHFAHTDENGKWNLKEGQLNEFRIKTVLEHPDALKDERVVDIVRKLVEECLIFAPYSGNMRLFTGPPGDIEPRIVDTPEGKKIENIHGSRLRKDVNNSHLPVIERLIEEIHVPNTIENERSFNLQCAVRSDIELALAEMSHHWPQESFPARLKLLKTGTVGFISFWNSFADETEIEALKQELSRYPENLDWAKRNIASAISMSGDAMKRDAQTIAFNRELLKHVGAPVS
jgi:hypothetical protein